MKRLKRRKRKRITYSLNLSRSNRGVALDEGGRLGGLGAVDEGRADREDRLLGGLRLVENVELGLGNGLGDVLIADGAGSDALESLDGLLGGLANGRGRAGKGDGQETGVRVDEVAGHSVGSRGSGNLGEEGESRRPLDGRLAAEKGSEDGGLGAGGGGGESDSDGIAGAALNALLSTVVGGSGGLDGLLAGSRNLVEELGGPLAQGALGGTVADESNVGLGVDLLGERGDGVFVKVALRGSSGRGVHG